ncbi:hypothetical protein E2C01_034633 [Portunus trituberculatus]|uniref:Uncharacterized protein n=1 Tax=Portunus trituberculatus TaxID=210409 RepID=A0A5B7F3C4_PORTR|nr:hypothetical protein [Portunus trituberculatus]
MQFVVLLFFFFQLSYSFFLFHFFFPPSPISKHAIPLLTLLLPLQHIQSTLLPFRHPNTLQALPCRRPPSPLPRHLLHPHSTAHPPSLSQHSRLIFQIHTLFQVFSSFARLRRLLPHQLSTIYPSTSRAAGCSGKQFGAIWSLSGYSPVCSASRQHVSVSAGGGGGECGKGREEGREEGRKETEGRQQDGRLREGG